MPTVLRFEGYRVVVYPNDHRPAHVNVIGNGNEAVFILNCPASTVINAGPVQIRENYGFTAKDIKRIMATLDRNVAMLCQEWRTIHGKA